MISLAELLRRPQGDGSESSSSSGRNWVNVDPTSILRDIPSTVVSIKPESRIIFHTDPHSPGADRIRSLRLRLRDLRRAKSLRRLVITSPLPGDGKSTMALNLATALAEGGKNTVLLMEADLHHPTLVKALDLRPTPGLAECLEDNIDPLLVLRRIEPLHFYFLQSGHPASNPSELLQENALSTIMQRIAPHFDWVIIDAPPVIPLTDALSLSKHADASLMVTRAGQTSREDVAEALTLIGPKNVVGIVLNGAETLNRAYEKYYGYYGGKTPSS